VKSLTLLLIFLLLALAYAVPYGVHEKAMTHDAPAAIVRPVEGDRFDDIDGQLLLYVWPGVEPLNDSVLSA
jgi:hypothetical protein